jgi:DNA polymerase III subunit delta'
VAVKKSAPAEEQPRLPLDAPWFAGPLERLADAARRGQQPQSLLIHAEPGAGGIEFGRVVAQRLLCEQPDAARPGGCGTCRGCTRVAAGQHPDLIEITPVDSTQIRVDQIREEVLQPLAMSSYEGRGTVVLFSPAEALNVAASNALLKNLEEPRRDAYLVLVASQPSRLSATIRSRCLRLALPAPSKDVALEWLQRHRPSVAWPAALAVLGTAPYAALELEDPAALVALRTDTVRTLQDIGRGDIDVVRTAEYWGKGGDFLHRLLCLENCLTGLTLRKVGLPADSSEMRPATHLPGPELDINIGTGLALLDDLREIRQLAATPLNKALLLERFLWRLSRATARPDQKGFDR